MKIRLPDLPWAEDALAPHISAETIEYHYGKHHRGYVEKLQKLLADEPSDAESLEDLLRTADGALYNMAAQVWNHTFYWESMKPGGGGKPVGPMATALGDAFGSFDDFRRAFHTAATGEFGSGWAWLCWDPGKRMLKVSATTDAENPISRGIVPLLTCDVWEHAYYLDYRN
jgi:Fe-Mn family superoxide dismutase